MNAVVLLVPCSFLFALPLMLELYEIVGSGKYISKLFQKTSAIKMKVNIKFYRTREGPSN